MQVTLPAPIGGIVEYTYLRATCPPMDLYVRKVIPLRVVWSKCQALSGLEKRLRVNGLWILRWARGLSGPE